MAAAFPLPLADEIMDVLIEVHHATRQGVRLVFIDSAGREVTLSLSGDVARDLRDALIEPGEDPGCPRRGAGGVSGRYCATQPPSTGSATPVT